MRLYLFYLSISSLFSISYSVCSTKSLCPSCCAVLFSSENCLLTGHEQKFNIREKGSGILGAIWDDVPKVAIVRKGCLLEAWDWKNQTGPKRAFGLDGMEVFHLHIYAFSDRISSVKCWCQKPVASTTTTTTLEPPVIRDEIDGLLRQESTEEDNQENDKQENLNNTISDINNNSTLNTS